MSDVIARTGRMDKKGNYVEDSVTVRIDDEEAEIIGIGKGPTEAEATGEAQAAIDRVKAEQAAFEAEQKKAEQ